MFCLLITGQFQSSKIFLELLNADHSMILLQVFIAMNLTDVTFLFAHFSIFLAEPLRPKIADTVVAFIVTFVTDDDNFLFLL